MGAATARRERLAHAVQAACSASSGAALEPFRPLGSAPMGGMTKAKPKKTGASQKPQVMNKVVGASVRYGIS